jgi:hypothetical protein
MAAAMTRTIKRFGPSGSLKKKNIVLEHTVAVRPRVSSVLFFDIDFIVLV